MRNLFFIVLAVFVSLSICKAEDCVKLKGPITPASKNLFLLKTTIEASSGELRKCQERINTSFKDSSKYKIKNIRFPILLESNKGQLSAKCDCPAMVYGGADSVDEIKYQFEMADCYSKVISKTKLSQPESLTSICWDGKFPIGQDDVDKKIENTADEARK